MVIRALLTLWVLFICLFILMWQQIKKRLRLASWCPSSYWRLIVLSWFYPRVMYHAIWKDRNNFRLSLNFISYHTSKTKAYLKGLQQCWNSFVLKIAKDEMKFQYEQSVAVVYLARCPRALSLHRRQRDVLVAFGLDRCEFILCYVLSDSLRFFTFCSSFIDWRVVKKS